MLSLKRWLEAYELEETNIIHSLYILWSLIFFFQWSSIFPCIAITSFSTNRTFLNSSYIMQNIRDET